MNFDLISGVIPINTLKFLHGIFVTNKIGYLPKDFMYNKINGTSVHSEFGLPLL